MAAQPIELQVEEISERAESGATEPYFCRLSDDNLYLVKGRAALARGLISEVVCARLGQEMGLPIPEFAVAYLPPALLELNPPAQASLGYGTVFASSFKKGLLQATLESLGTQDPELLRKIFLFDYWVRNEDRTGSVYGGNPNLFIDAENGGLVVIDHNLAFDQAFDLHNFLTTHICRGFWQSSSGLRLDHAALADDLDTAINRIEPLEDGLPEAWLEQAPNFIDEVREILSARNLDTFWEKI